MRKTLFRGKRILNDKWAKGHVAVVGGKTFIISDKATLYVEPDGGWKSIENLIEVDPETLGQWTGLKDRDGVDVFEGDVWRGHYHNKPFTGVIEWDDGYAGFCVNDGAGTRMQVLGGWRNTMGGEIIGNIHDTPALLEESNGGN